ncbi:MAG: zinc ribbon domain-containing protein, partial [Aquiluna sp.]
NDEFVRDNVAEHPNTPVDLLAELSIDDRDIVRKAVAENPRTSITVFEAIFRHLAESSSKDESRDVNRNLDESGGSRPAAPTCLTCGANLSSSAKFCSSCGEEVTPPIRFCSQCGDELSPGTRFCAQCGAPTTGAAASEENDSDEIAETDISELCEWILGAIEPLPRQAKTKRIDFLAYDQSTLVFSVEFAYDVFDFRLNKSLLDLDTLLGDGYPEFTDKDSVEPRTFIHAYWNVEDWDDLGPELVEDIVRMVDSDEWVKSAVSGGMLGEKVKVERWS